MASTDFQGSSGSSKLSQTMTMGIWGFACLICRGHDRTVQQSQVVLHPDCIDWLRHQLAQALLTAGCSDQTIALLLEVQ
jgi:hypothetical protein